MAHEPASGFEAAPDDEALIVYTSGTTGHPKGVVLTQSNLLVDAAGIARWHGMTPGERMMCVLPIHHVNGTVVTLVTPLAYGGTAVLCRKFQTDRFLPRLAAERIGVVSVVPTLLSFLLQGGASAEGLDLSAFRQIICGAGPLTVELALQFQDRFGLRIVHGYGLSETTCYSCFLPVDLDDAAQRGWLGDHGFPSIGCAIPANDMDIHDEAGASVPVGERGEIVIRGHNVMTGYFLNDEANADAFAHGWFRSGDEGFRLDGPDGRGYFFITGRLKELIIRGGVNVSPLEVDEVLMNLPGVKAGVSVGFENDMYGEEIGAYVVMDEGAPRDAEAIVAACREELPHHKRPKVVVFGDEVPVTSTGKYQRNRLKPLFAEWRSAQFRKEG
jgi:long-chain acyl-CoA synthetase